GAPGASPGTSSCAWVYGWASRSPREAGARPSSRSEAKKRTCPRRRFSVIARAAVFSAGETMTGEEDASPTADDTAGKRRSETNAGSFFIEDPFEAKKVRKAVTADGPGEASRVPL